MLNNHKRKIAGFTLIELAIVLGIAGILFGGLWRLLSTSNTQMRDQATATHHQQIVNAVASYLQSSGDVTDATGGGQAFVTNLPVNTPTTINLPLQASPASTTTAGRDACAAALGALLPDNRGICSFLPPGFNVTSTNPYGQTYQVRIVKTGDQVYSFMVLTTGVDRIPDTSGGRISAMIGGDGGFIYSSNVCQGAPVTNRACGSFGGWSSDLADFGWAPLAAPGRSGHIASRTYNGGSLALGSWLARKQLPGDTGDLAAHTPPEYNTMQTDLYLGGKKTFFAASTDDTATAGGGTMYLQGGQIDLGGGSDHASITGDLQAGGQTFINLTSQTNNALISLASPTHMETAFIITKGGMVITDGFINSATFTYTNSDKRLKKDIKPLNSLAEIMKIKPVTFTYKATGRGSMGVIAQDLEKIYPQLVLDGKDGMKSVSYEGLIAPLVSSVQELKKENDRLNAVVTGQIQKQERMEKEIERLKNK